VLANGSSSGMRNVVASKLVIFMAFPLSRSIGRA
jgi:hypothetical protein